MCYHVSTHATFQGAGQHMRQAYRLTSPKVNEKIFESHIWIFLVGLHWFGFRNRCASLYYTRASTNCPLDTYPVAPVWFLLLRMWFSPGQPRTSHPGRRCLPELCRLVHPTLLGPCRSQSHRWRRSAAWLGHLPIRLRSFCSDQSLPPTGTFLNFRFPEASASVNNWITK